MAIPSTTQFLYLKRFFQTFKFFSLIQSFVSQ